MANVTTRGWDAMWTRTMIARKQNIINVINNARSPLAETLMKPDNVRSAIVDPYERYRSSWVSRYWEWSW